MAIADDLQLVRLAREPARALFPVLDRASAMTPLVLLFAIVPGLLVLHSHPLDERDAEWGLKSLAVMTAGNIEEMVDPPVNDIPANVRWYPPLGTWLTALCLAFTDPSWSARLALASYFATLALVILTFVLIRRILGTRIGFLAVILLSCHEQLLQQALVSVPNSLAIVLAILAISGFLGHLRDPSHLVSLRLLLGGVGLGLCLLAAGQLAMLVFGIFFLHVVLWDLTARNGNSKNGHSTTWQNGIGGSALMSLLVLGLTALSIGGWWHLMMSQRHGLEFWSVWTRSTATWDPQSSANAPMLSMGIFVQQTIQQFVSTLGFLLGFSVLGFWRACHEVVMNPGSARRQSLQFLIVWSLLACVWALRFPEVPSDNASLWILFALIPFIVLSALGIDEISQRRVTPTVVIASAVLTAIGLTFQFDSLHSALIGIGRADWTKWLLPALLLAIGYRLSAMCRSSEVCSRRVLAGITLLLMFADMMIGVISIRASAGDKPDAGNLQRRLVTIQNVRECTLVTTDEPPLRLRYLVRSVWPRATLEIINHFEPIGPSTTDIEPRDGQRPSRASETRATKPASASNDSRGDEESLQIVIVWGKDVVSLSSAKEDSMPLEPLGSPQFFDNRLLSIYRRP